MLGGRNGPEMFEKLEKKITSLKITGRKLVLSISYVIKRTALLSS